MTASLMIYLLFFCTIFVDLIDLSSGSAQNHVTSSRNSNKITIDYAVDFPDPIIANSFVAKASRDKLTCFGNNDVAELSIVETLGCLLSIPGSKCSAVWGSRVLQVNTNASLELFRTLNIPEISQQADVVVTESSSKPNSSTSQIHAQRWLHLDAHDGKEMRTIPAEPFYLCARSNDWIKGTIADFEVIFRPIYIRESDQYESTNKLLVHFLLVAVLSSMWLLPYLIALVGCVYAFTNGLTYFVIVLTISGFVLLLTPFMLKKSNRHLARHYLKYFFTRVQAEETRQVIKERLPLFQALFFSSTLIFLGSAGSYIIYSYSGIDRETRNFLLRMTIAIASGWLIFFLCRSFERFCHDWMWVGLSLALSSRLELHINPMCRDKVMIASLFINFVMKFIIRKVFAKSFATVAAPFKSGLGVDTSATMLNQEALKEGGGDDDDDEEEEDDTLDSVFRNEKGTASHLQQPPNLTASESEELQNFLGGVTTVTEERSSPVSRSEAEHVCSSIGNLNPGVTATLVSTSSDGEEIWMLKCPKTAATE